MGAGRAGLLSSRTELAAVPPSCGTGQSLGPLEAGARFWRPWHTRREHPSVGRLGNCAVRKTRAGRQTGDARANVQAGGQGTTSVESQYGAEHAGDRGMQPAPPNLTVSQQASEVVSVTEFCDFILTLVPSHYANHFVLVPIAEFVIASTGPQCTTKGKLAAVGLCPPTGRGGAVGLFALTGR